MSRILTIGGRREAPTPPVAIADEVELYAREHNRHATLHHVQIGFGKPPCWLIRMTLRSDDKRLKGFREGRLTEKPHEDIWLHVATEGGEFEPLDLDQLGPSGVRAFLERGNTWGGRADHKTLEDHVRDAHEANARHRAANKQQQKQLTRDYVNDRRRQVLGIPLITVGLDLKGDT